MNQEEYYARMFIRKCFKVMKHGGIKSFYGYQKDTDGKDIPGTGIPSYYEKEELVDINRKILNGSFGPGAYKRYKELKKSLINK